MKVKHSDIDRLSSEHLWFYPYSTTDIAQMLDDKRVNGNRKLRKFLHEQGVIMNGYEISPEYCEVGFFIVEMRITHHPIKRFPALRVSREGAEFIKNLVTENLK